MSCREKVCLFLLITLPALCDMGCGESHSTSATDAATDGSDVVDGSETLDRFFALYERAIQAYCDCAPCGEGARGPTSSFQECLYSESTEQGRAVVDYFGAFATYLEGVLSCFDRGSCRDVIGEGCTARGASQVPSAVPSELRDIVRECAGVAAVRRVEEIMSSYYAAAEERWLLYCGCLDCSEGGHVVSEATQACMISSIYLAPEEFESFFASLLDHELDLVTCYEGSSCGELAEGACRLPLPDAVNQPNPNVATSLSRCMGR